MMSTLPCLSAENTAADLVVTDARIYTVDNSHSVAQALAVRSGKLVFVGSTAAAQHWIGPSTTVKRLRGKLVLPGLFDSHIHPIAIVKEDVCDLKSAEKESESACRIRAGVRTAIQNSARWLAERAPMELHQRQSARC
jgi:predicted amidohydrolase YtcJ